MTILIIDFKKTEKRKWKNLTNDKIDLQRKGLTTEVNV